jgi:hypothetical protein
MDQGRVAVFVEYKENTIRQYQVYAPDLSYVIRTSVVIFDEYQKGGTVDLRIQITLNILLDRNPHGRSRKEPASSNTKSIRMPSSTPAIITSESMPQEINQTEKFLWIEIPQHQPDNHVTATSEVITSEDYIKSQIADRSIDLLLDFTLERQQANRSCDQSANINNPQRPDSSSEHVGRLQSTHTTEP